MSSMSTGKSNGDESMKKAAVIMLFIMIMPFTASAEGKNCDPIEGIAKNMMKLRQGGVPMSHVVKGFGGEQINPEIKMLIIRAYEYPRYHSSENQKAATVKFRNEIYLECIKEYEWVSRLLNSEKSE